MKECLVILAEAIICMEFVKVADQECVSVAQVKIGYTFHKASHALHDVNGDNWWTRCCHGCPCGPNFSSCQFPQQSWEGDHTVFGFFPSVCLRVGSIATCRIVSFRGEGFSVVCSNRHFVWCAVRSSAHKHFVGCIVSTYTICYVFTRVLISSATVCFDISCCMQGTPTEHFSSMFMCIVFSFQTNTDSGTDDSKNTLHVASASNMLPRFGRQRFTTIQFIHRNKVGRALLLVPTSNTIPRIHICPSADASSVAIGVVVHVSASPKLFVVFVIWARFHHWTHLISK